MTNFDVNALFTQIHYAWDFRIMLGDIHDFLKFSEHNIEQQLLDERQSIQRRTLDSFGFDDNDLAQSYEDDLLERATHRLTVALPMQIRYAVLGALTNTVEWASRFFQSHWKSHLPTKPKNLRNPEATATSLLEHFSTTLSLPKTSILDDYPHLVKVRNAVVHNSGVFRNYNKPKVLRNATDALKGFSITDWHFIGECVRIERGALDPYIEGMSQLLEDIHKAADERELLRS